MNFCKVKAGRLCWIYPGTSFCRFPMSIEPPYFTRLTFIGYLMMSRLFNLHPIIQPLTLVKQDLVFPFNHPLLTIPTSKHLRSIQEEQVFLRAFVAFENAALRDFVQECHDEFHAKLATQTQYFQDYRACLEI